MRRSLALLPLSVTALLLAACSMDATSSDASMEVQLSSATACGATACAPPAPRCDWSGKARIVASTPRCLSPETDPRCVFKETREECEYACVDGACVAPACTQSNGAPRIDFCGNAKDEDCSGASRTCGTQPASRDGLLDVDVYPGLVVERETIDLWALATSFPDSALVGLRLRNQTGETIRYSVDGYTLADIAPGGDKIVNPNPSWTRSSRVDLYGAGTEHTRITVGYFEPPASPARLVGFYTTDGGATRRAASIELQVVPRFIEGGKRYPKTIDECVGWSECVAYVDVSVTLETASGPQTWRIHPDISSSKARIRWRAAEQRFRLQIPFDGPIHGGGLDGTPEAMTGSVWKSGTESISGVWTLHFE